MILVSALMGVEEEEIEFKQRKWAEENHKRIVINETEQQQAGKSMKQRAGSLERCIQSTNFCGEQTEH